MGDDDWVLDAPWPPGLDPIQAGFRVRTETVLRRVGIWEEMTRLDDITADDVLGWENAGVKTVEDLRLKANAAIVTYLEVAADERRAGIAADGDRRRREAVERRAQVAAAEARRRREAEQQRISDKLVEVAAQPWAVRVWRRDPRFRDLLPPRWEVRTIRDLALRGTEQERHLLGTLIDGLEVRVAQLAGLPLETAVVGYVEAVSSQHGIRLTQLLACTGLGGRDPITQTEAAGVLGVSHQRVSQIVAQLYRRRDKVTPPGGIWMPQVDAAMSDGWPDGYTTEGITAIRRFFKR